MAKTAIITGISGQDGAYLAELLVSKGYHVVGAARRNASGSLWRLEELGVADQVEVEYFELLEQNSLPRLLRKHRPDEFYNLAAQSFVGTSFDEPIYTANVDGMAVAQILDDLRTHSPDTRFYQASTSEMFGKVQEVPQTEATPFYPRSPYGVAKLFAHWMTVNYREAHGLHASSGILFNHESPLRGPEFVTRKITHQLARIASGKQSCIELGNLSAERDWGFAKEYVEAMWRMLQQPEGDDYVIATGQTHSIREFVNAAAPIAGFDIEWQGTGEAEVGVDLNTNKEVIRVNPKFFRPAEVDRLLGNPRKASTKLGWQASTTVDDLAKLMMQADLERSGQVHPVSA